jgi:hypothetical protein
MLDLAKNNPAEIAEAGYEFTVVLPDGTETDAKIKVRGLFSPKVKEFAKKMYKEHQIKVQAAKRKGREPEDMTLEEAEEYSVRVAAVRVISWSGISEDGVTIESTKDEVERILMKYPFIREQVITESDNVLNFRHD